MSTRSLSLKMIVFMALVAVAYTGIASCGGDSRPVPPRGADEMVIVPPTDNRTPDHPNTPAGATAIELSESFQGRIDSADDVDYFRLRVDSPGTLTIRTTGNGDPDIAVFEGAGEEVQRVSGSWIGRITQEILDRGSDLLVRFSRGNAGGEYTGSATLDQTPQTSPDLVAGSPTVSDSSPETGGAFTLSATVSNQGDGESAATTLRYFRSTDATITTSDTEVGTDAVAGLAPSGSDSRSVDMAAPSAPGTYHYGACVDAVAGESNTANNCSTSVQVQVTVREPEHPDLTVVSPTVSDNRPAPGASFTLSATVRNDGNGESAATTLRYYRSVDGTITTSDTEVGTDAVAGLAASGSDSRSVDMVAPTAPGPYYYGACVDAVAGESNTANNCSTSVQVTVREPEHPDLTVVSPTVSDNRPAPGASFTLSATVRNDGNGESAATTLRYYRSADATITTADTEVGTDAAAGLAASGSDSRTLDMAAPSAPGTYYYGACVEAVAGESNTANNCSTSVQVTVQEPEHPDLMVVSPSVSDNRPAPGASFTLSATVPNDGNGESAATTLRYFRSADATITMSDKSVGTDAVSGLAASVSDSRSVDMAAPSAPGTYYYGACVDAVAGESNTANNCSTAVQIKVLLTARQIQRFPDLVVGTPTASPGRPAAGTAFTLSATVGNTGGATSPSTLLRYYRSRDATITRSDTPVGTDAVPALAAAGRSNESISVTAPSNPGIYYYGACVDTVNGESETTNNCSLPVTVTSRGSDLVVGTPTVSAGSPAAGTAFTLSARVSNTGSAASPPTTLRYYRSRDATITRSDTPVGTDAVGALAAAGRSNESISVTAPSNPGIYYYGACVDAVNGESETTNNCSLPVTVTSRGSDLVVGTPTVSAGSPAAGTAFTLSATVRNTGSAASPPTTLRYYRSLDATITRSDTPVGTDAVPALGAAVTSSESISVTAPSNPGIYYYGACVDAVNGESETTNNCSLPVTVTVPSSSPGSDLVVGTPTASAGSPAAGTAFTLSATVSNTGGAASLPTTLRFYRSVDIAITGEDTEVGTAALSGLAASGSGSGSVSLTAPSNPGIYYYGACVDAVNGESDTTNNCSLHVTVTVREPRLADLVVDAPTVRNSSPTPGGYFNFGVTVRNTGDMRAPSTALVCYRSTDATITRSDTSLGRISSIGSIAAGGTYRVACSTSVPLSPAVTYYYGACVGPVAGEPDTENNCSPSVAVTAPDISPDLVVGGRHWRTMHPGADFQVLAWVRNTGDGDSRPTTLRFYYSTDLTITRSDTPLGTAAIGGLDPGMASRAEVASATAPWSAGIHYYGACVDAVVRESDTANNCSLSVTVRVR